MKTTKLLATAVLTALCITLCTRCGHDSGSDEVQIKRFEKVLFGTAANDLPKVLKEQERSEAWLARKVHCDPGNFNRILKKRSIDIDLLRRISMVLAYNFIREYAQVVEQQLTERPEES